VHNVLRYTGIVSRPKRTALIVGPDFDGAFDNEKDIMRFSMIMETNGHIPDATLSEHSEGIVCFAAGDQQSERGLGARKVYYLST
jgi:hypothetical protein